MMFPYYRPDINLFAFLFDIALISYIRSASAAEDVVRAKYTQYLYAATVVCGVDLVRTVLPEGDVQQWTGILSKAFLVVMFMRYILNVARDERGGLPKGIAALSLVIFGIGAAINLFAFPQLLVISFAASLVAYINFFALETPVYIRLEQRLTELEGERERAEKAREAAVKENESMNDFLANMSHEIRTPLTAILGYDEVILNDATEEDVLDYAEDILRAGNTLLYIVNDILDFTRIESGEMSLEIKEYHLAEVIDNIDNMIRKKASDKGLEYRTKIDGTIPDRLLGDGIRLNQIMLNLLNNAVKYTNRGSVELAVSMSSGSADDEILLHIGVSDTGIGIREEDRKDLFLSFARIDELRNKGVEGTGLGLPITAELTRMMNGELSFDSTYGEGSVFRVTIPQKVLGIRTLREYADVKSEDLRVMAAKIVAPSARLLVVDDNLTNRTVVVELLRHTMVQIDTAESGAECLSLVKENAYDLILLDQMMPNMSGPETLAHMKTMEDNRSARAPVIAFTADAVAGARERLLSAGFDDYLSKPVTGADLTNILIDYLPHEKILLPGDVGYENAMASAEAAREDPSKSENQTILENLQGIDLAYALSMCGSKEVLLAAVRDFYHTITSQADLIERYLTENDLRNLTIKVHALKSASNFIGARQLSADAAYLEERGNKEDVETLREKVPKLLADYRAYRNYLEGVEPKEGKDLPEIDAEDLLDAYREICLFAKGYDFDSVDAVMEALSAYAVPGAEKERYETLTALVTNVNREGILELLGFTDSKA